MAKTQKRGFTIGDRRTFNLEKRTLPLTVLVALMAAIISFVALRWVGLEMGWSGRIAPLLPLSIDGLGIICALGIVRSNSAQEPWRARASEWVGLSMSLVLSMLGNAYHALGAVPPWLTVLYAVAVPGIVAYSIHVLGRYLQTGISHNIDESDPDQIVLNIARVGGEQPATQRAPRPAPRTAHRATASTAQPATAPTEQPPSSSRAHLPADPSTDAAQPLGKIAANKKMQAAVEAALREDLDAEYAATGAIPKRPVVTKYADLYGDNHESTPRRWVSKAYAAWVLEHEDRDDVNPPTPIRANVTG